MIGTDKQWSNAQRSFDNRSDDFEDDPEMDCPECGYDVTNFNTCPKCGENCEDKQDDS